MIVHARIDNRLLHGIVATQWAPASGANRIMVIDNAVAENPVQKESMRLGKPPGTAVSIITEETALNNFKAGKYDGQKVFVIAQNPDVMLALLEEAGQELKSLNIGCTAVASGESIQVSKRAYITPEASQVYCKLAAHGVELYVQYVPLDQKKKLSEFIDL